MKEDVQSPSEQVQPKRLRSEMRVFYGASHESLLSGFSVDLSTGGLFLKTDSPLDLDESLILRFKLSDDSRVVSCQARVAWVNEKDNPRKPELPAGVGVQFVDMTFESMKMIKRFLEHNIIEPKW
jgi:uncharacterized protein (TIGR02266 family)